MDKKLTKKETAAQNLFIEKLDIKKRKTSKSIVIAIIGLVGSGKSSVALELGELIGATIIESDSVRIELRKQGESYEKSRIIVENATAKVIKRGGNVVVDSDFVDKKKREDICKRMLKVGASIFFIRVYCDMI